MDQSAFDNQMFFSFGLDHDMQDDVDNLLFCVVAKERKNFIFNSHLYIFNMNDVTRARALQLELIRNIGIRCCTCQRSKLDLLKGSTSEF